MFRTISMLWVGVAAVGLVVGPATAEEMTRPEKEKYLKKAKVISVKDVGEGATKPLKVKLERDGVQMKTIFKSVDLYMKSATRFGSETVDEYRDSYKHEIAAYELDKLLGQGMLPVVVERRIKGKRGALREWIDDVMPHYGHGNSPPDMDRERNRIQMMWLFDYLIYNVDRRIHNLMIGSNWKPVLIDHSMAFTTFEKPFRPLYRFPREVISRLRTLDQEQLRKALGRYLKPNQIKAVLRRSRAVVVMADREVAEKGEAEVFFSLADLFQ